MTKFERHGLQCELLWSGPSEECGCPEERWLVGNIEAIVHYEEDGSGHIILDGGDWQDERDVVNVSSLTALRDQAIDWVGELPREE